MNSRLPILALFLIITGCYEPQRDCLAFRNGEFQFTAVVDGQELTTTFIRQEGIEIDYFQGKSDTSSVRWINDCEYIVKKINPKNRSEEKSVHMKILTTTADSYTFEYSIVGSPKKSKGTAVKIK